MKPRTFVSSGAASGFAIDRPSGSAWVVDRFRAHSHPFGQTLPPELMRGDHSLNPGTCPPPPYTPAAVLVPIVQHPTGLSVLFTERTAHLTNHAGQVSFPGGRMEDGDGSAEETALRETEEEIGLSRDRVEIIGRLDRYITRTGFEVTPVVALALPPFELTLDTFEVAEVFEVPLSHLLDPANHRKEYRLFAGRDREFWAIPCDGHYIWGATAGMLMNLYDILGTP